MKFIVNNSSGVDLWAMASRVDLDGNSFVLIEFFLTGDPVDGDVPEPVPPPPKCIVVEIPEAPIQYIAPEGYILNSKAVSITAPDGDNGIAVEILEVTPATAGPKGPPN